MSEQSPDAERQNSTPQDFSSIELPPWPPLQRIKNNLIFIVLRLLFKALERIPFPICRKIAKLLGIQARLIAKKEERRAIAQVSSHYSNGDNVEARGIVEKMFVHLAMASVEAIHCDKLITQDPTLKLTAEQRTLLDDAVAEKKGVIAVTGHIGPWELLAQVLAKEGYPITSVAKPTYDPRLTHWVDQWRGRHGMEVLWRGTNSSPKEILRTFKRQRILRLLIDQDTKVPGVFSPFFNQEAWTPSAPALFALRTQAPIIVGWIHRTGNQYKIHLERFEYKHQEMSDEAILSLTTALNQRLEEAIRMFPEQWVWLHSRWKTRPQSRPTPGKKCDFGLKE